MSVAYSMRMNSAASCSVARCRPFLASPIAPACRPTLAPAKVSLITVVVEAKAKARSLKTRKSAAKRFKVTGSGKLVARHAGKQHFNEKKSANHVNNLDRKFVLEAGDVPRAVKCLPHSGVGGK